MSALINTWMHLHSRLHPHWSHWNVNMRRELQAGRLSRPITQFRLTQYRRVRINSTRPHSHRLLWVPNPHLPLLLWRNSTRWTQRRIQLMPKRIRFSFISQRRKSIKQGRMGTLIKERWKTNLNTSESMFTTDHPVRLPGEVLLPWKAKTESRNIWRPQNKKSARMQMGLRLREVYPLWLSLILTTIDHPIEWSNTHRMTHHQLIRQGTFRESRDPQKHPDN